MFKKLKSLMKRSKVFVVACAIALAVAATTIAASAATAEAGAGTGANAEMQSMMIQAGEQLQGQFSTLVGTIIPIVLGILGSGLVIFGIFALIKFAKKTFGKVAG